MEPSISKIDFQVNKYLPIFYFFSFSIGKLELSGVKPDELPEFANKTGFEIVQVDPNEAANFYNLPRLSHKDLFDHLLIWQAIQRQMILISKDKSFMEYKKHGLRVSW